MMSSKNRYWKKKSEDISAWSIVHFESVDEDESFNDLIPSSWISNTGSLAWYPMNEHKESVQKLVKQCAKANSDWNCFPIKIIEEDIGKYYNRKTFLI